MRRNVEIKARATDLPRQAAVARRLADGPPSALRQHDTFYVVTSGRLKLRRIEDAPAELIHYSRPDAADVKTCRYTLTTVSDPDALDAVLSAALGRRGSVRKARTLFLSGHTRIHLDEVAGLGPFIELEVVLADADSEEDGRREARRLMDALHIRETDLEDVAYIDLLERSAPAGPATPAP